MRLLEATSTNLGGSSAQPAQVVPSAPPANAALRTLLALVEARPHELEAIVGTSPEGVVAFDHNRRILHANTVAEELFGYGRGGLEGTSTDALVPERLRQPNAPPMTATADVMQVVLPGLRRDGTELAVEWAFGSVPTASGPIFVMTVCDRSVSDLGLEALRASEERFRLLVDGLDDYAIFMLDAKGHVSSWNKGAERSNGLVRRRDPRPAV